MLTGAGFGDHALFAHAAHEQALPEHVVGLVRAGVVQILALDEDARAAEVPGEVLRERERRRPTRVFAHERLVLAPERWIGLRFGEGRLEIVESGDEDFRNVRAAEITEIAARFALKIGLRHRG